MLCGIEAHVCVNQTAEDLLTSGKEVHVVQDAVSSRTAANRDLGLHKMERSGAFCNDAVQILNPGYSQRLGREELFERDRHKQPVPGWHRCALACAESEEMNA